MEAHRGNPASWLARTKLAPPPLRSDVLARPRVLDAVRTALAAHRLTLISAPAGYGKTTLLSALAATAAPDLALAWLSLDEGENDLRRFLTALVAAFHGPLPGCGSATLSLLASPAGGLLLDPHHVVGMLVNDLLESIRTPTALVLDDLHLIAEPLVYVALDYFLERLPPLVHLVIATRRDPPLALARLRARGELAEFRLADLRFTAQETTLLLNGQLRLNLSSDQLAYLQARTEGWPAGVRLLASSLEQMPSARERAAFLAALSRGDQHIFEFLAAEVLERQDPSLRRFLLETAVLAELTAAACQAVTGRDDAEAVLADLDRRGLFVMPVDAARTVFRYHALFAEFLQRRLQRELPGRVGELHRRAAQAEGAPDRAVSHYLAAQEWEEAATLVAQAAPSLLRDGFAGTVNGWIQAVPAAVRDRHPRLWLLLGMSAFLRSDLPAAREHLERAQHALAAAADIAGAGKARSHLAACMLLQADFAGAAAMVERALSQPLSPSQQLRLLMTRCWLAVFRGDSAAAADLTWALTAAEEAGAPEALLALIFQFKPDRALLPGGLAQLEHFIQQVRPWVGADGTPASLALQDLVSFVHFWRGRVDQAREVGQTALAQAAGAGGYVQIGPHAAVFGGLACLVRQDYAAAQRLLEHGIAQARKTPLGQVAAVGWPLYLLGRLRLLQADLAGARAVWEQLGAEADGRRNVYAPVLRLRLQGWLHLAEGRYAAAEGALREALAQEERLPVLRLAGTARVALARLAYERRQPEAALAELAPVLAACEAQDTPGLLCLEGREVVPLLQLARRRGVHTALTRRVLALLVPAERHAALAASETGAVLTPREREVLALLAAGARTRAIAEHLVVTPNTVKTHLANLLRKLNAATRAQAVARARAAGLLGSPPTR